MIMNNAASFVSNEISYVGSLFNSQKTLLIWGIFALIIIAIMIALLISLRKNMDEANENNARINQYLAAISDRKIGNVNAIYLNAKKDLGIALVLTFILGGFGGHKIYLGRKKSSILYFLFCWTLIPSLLALFDAVAMPNTIAKYNLSVMESLYDQLAAPQTNIES